MFKKQLTLALLMARVFANYTHNALSLHNFAVAAHPFYRCLHFHFPAPGVS
jgi:hypothetical protein